MTATSTTTRTHRAASAFALAGDGLDMQQCAMGSAGQLAALLEQPYSGDAQQTAMGSASQSLLGASSLGAAHREGGSYVTGATPSSSAGSYVTAPVA